MKSITINNKIITKNLKNSSKVMRKKLRSNLSLTISTPNNNKKTTLLINNEISHRTPILIFKRKNKK